MKRKDFHIARVSDALGNEGKAGKSTAEVSSRFAKSRFEWPRLSDLRAEYVREGLQLLEKSTKEAAVGGIRVSRSKISDEVLDRESRAAEIDRRIEDLLTEDLNGHSNRRADDIYYLVIERGNRLIA